MLVVLSLNLRSGFYFLLGTYYLALLLMQRCNRWYPLIVGLLGLVGLVMILGF